MKTNPRLMISTITILGFLLGAGLSTTPASAAAPGPNWQPAQKSFLLASGIDSDHDGLTDAQERLCGTNPKLADSNHNGLPDGLEDTDHDGLSNSREASLGTGCKTKDTDHDGLSDGAEISRGINPLNKDSDGDGRSDGDEINKYHSNPSSPDSSSSGSSSSHPENETVHPESDHH